MNDKEKEIYKKFIEGLIENKKLPHIENVKLMSLYRIKDKDPKFILKILLDNGNEMYVSAPVDFFCMMSKMHDDFHEDLNKRYKEQLKDKTDPDAFNCTSNKQ